MSAAAATLKLTANVPEVIALAFAQGREVTSQFGGDQVMFTLCDGRRAYFPPFVAEKIYAAGIPARQPFAIIKREVVHGNKRSIEYVIENHNETGAAHAKENAPVLAVNAAVSRTHQHPNHSAALEVAAQLAASLDKPTWSELQAQQAAPAQHPETLAMIEAHKRAIDVAAAAEAYANTRGLAIRYAAEDIRAIAATMFINNARTGR
jgi:hypothetical protein